MFDQAFIMRCHQTARVPRRAGYPRYHHNKADLQSIAAQQFFPAVSADTDGRQSWQGAANSAKGVILLEPEGGENESLGDLKNTNLINYNFNQNTRQEHEDDDEEDNAISHSLPRPMNTKGGPRIGKGDGDEGEPEMSSSLYQHNVNKGPEGNYLSQKQSPKPQDDNIRQTANSFNFGHRRDGKFASLPRMNREPTTVHNQAAHLNLNRTVLYKRGHLLETTNSFFIIEISATQEGAMIIAAFDIQTGSSMLIQQRPEIAVQTLQIFNNDFQSIAEAVQLCEDGRSLRLGKPGIKRAKDRANYSQHISQKMNRLQPALTIDHAYNEWPELLN